MNGSHAVAIRMSALGDVVLATGVLAHWHRTRAMRFTFVTKARYAPLLQDHPAIERVVAVEPAASGILPWARLAHCLAREWEGALLIDLHGSLRAHVAWSLWRGPKRRFPRYARERRRYLRDRSSEARAVLLMADIPQRYAMALDEEPPPPESVRPRVFLSSQEIEAARCLLRDRGVGTRPVILHPYAVHPLKTWPTRAWVELARALQESGREWCAIGRDPAPFLGAVDRARDLTNLTDLRTTCAVLACGSVLVSGDSGPLHLAEAVGTPVVALFGPTTREWGFYPRMVHDAVLELPLPCRPCTLHGRARVRCAQECLVGITPEAVLAQLEAVRP